MVCEYRRRFVRFATNQNGRFFRFCRCRKEEIRTLVRRRRTVHFSAELRNATIRTSLSLRNPAGVVAISSRLSLRGHASGRGNLMRRHFSLRDLRRQVVAISCETLHQIATSGLRPPRNDISADCRVGLRPPRNDISADCRVASLLAMTQDVTAARDDAQFIPEIRQFVPDFPTGAFFVIDCPSKGRYFV